MPPLPTFDSPAFAKWLRRWKEAENLEWGEIAKRSGVAVGTLQQLARGVPAKKAIERGQTDQNPGIATIARLAHGLGLEFGYVASKGGMLGGGADRWEHFSKAERALIATALREAPVPRHATGDIAEQDRLLQELAQLDPPMTEEVPA